MDYARFKRLTFNRKKLSAFGTQLLINDPDDGSMIGYTKMKLFNLRGDVRIYSDQSMTTEIVRIGGRQVISLQKVYDIYDSANGQLIAAVRQRSLASRYFRDYMDIMDGSGNQIGYLQETSSVLALVGRLVSPLIYAVIPQTFDIMSQPAGSISPQVVGSVVHHRNLIWARMTLDLTNSQAKFDPRLNIALVSLLMLLDVDNQR